MVQTEKSKAVAFSGKNTKPYILVDKKEQIADVAKVGFYSDFHCCIKDLEKFPGDQLWMIRFSLLINVLDRISPPRLFPVTVNGFLLFPIKWGRLSIR